jgi:AcrR family transcriptional regulator
MSLRQRAIHREDKEERHAAIVEAALRVLLRAPERELNMADVADEAGLAKGTVYLYFAGKEELLLALHERNVAGFFHALSDRLERTAPVAIEEFIALVHQHIIAAPLYLPLASRCLGVMSHVVDPEAARAFKQRMTALMQRAGAGLEQHFSALAPGDGVMLLRHTYALVLGLWQISLASPGGSAPCRDAAPEDPLKFAFAPDLERALLALWRGTLAPVRADTPAH